MKVYMVRPGETADYEAIITNDFRGAVVATQVTDYKDAHYSINVIGYEQNQKKSAHDWLFEIIMFGAQYLAYFIAVVCSIEAIVIAIGLGIGAMSPKNSDAMYTSLGSAVVFWIIALLIRRFIKSLGD
jgi:hypothetical protein